MAHGDGYRFVEQVGSGGGSVLWRAVSEDERSVILKQLRDEHPSSREAQRLGREVDIARRLRGSNAAVQVLGSEVVSGHPTLVLEDFHGRSLDQLLGDPLPVRVFLKLAIALAQGLAEVHRREIIHRDIKPRNIIVDDALEVVKLTDFGIASVIPVEQPAALPADLIEGTPPYMSPEQTGRMNRAVDYRTDLYSLGVTFYEMLTGRLPFAGRDTLEWFHAHLAKAPVDPAELIPDPPRAICAIVLKLLAKAAEDRYQSALGLKADLQRCLEQLEASGRIETFPLGAHDVSERFQIPQKLYGRDAELAGLREAFDRVTETGAPQLVLVAGYAGIGKSALVHELHTPVVRERGYFLSGKFDQYQRDIPYSTITQAFRELVQQILAEGEEKIAVWKRQLQAALGINGRLVIDIVPQLELIIGPQPDVPELPATEAQNRLQIVFERFVGVCATRQHPLVLFLDDLQWVDPGSLRLIEHLITHPETRFLMLIGAYRDNEVGPSHPLVATVERITRAGAKVQTVKLGPLTRPQLRQFVADTLHCDPARGELLAQLVHDKTEGNPFFFIHFLRTLHQEGLIELEPHTGTWTWDIKRIEAQGFSDNVVDLMVGRLKRLTAATQEVLRQGASLGNQFALDTLATVCEQPEEAVEEALREALRERQVSLSTRTYQFVHDRVQQAAYSLIPAAERGAVHLRIGRLLLASTLPEHRAESVFDIVNQLNQGVDLITAPEERATLCRLNVQAGRKAKVSTAYASARSFLDQALALLPADAWDAQYQDTLALHLELSECEYLLGNLQRASLLHDLVLQKARSNPDRARAYRLRIRLYQTSDRYADSVSVALEALGLFGIQFPEADPQIMAAFVAEHQEVAPNLRGRSIPTIIDAAPVEDPDVMATIGLLIEVLPSLYIARPSLFPLFAVRAVNLSLRHGNSAEACFAYTVYGMILVGAFGDFLQASQFSEMSLKLNERLHDTRLRGSLLFLHAGFINPWRKHIATSRPLMEQAFAATLDVGDMVYAGYTRDNFIRHAMERGDPLDEVMALARECEAFTQQNRLHMTHEHIRVYRQWAACLRGSTRGPTSFDDDLFSESSSLEGFAKARYVTGIVCFHIAKQCTAVVMGDWAEALEHAQRAAPLLPAVMAMPISATHHFYYALALAALYPQASAPQQEQFARLLKEKVELHAHWAKHCPENYLDRHALVSAEVARIEGRALEAQHLYEEAIRSARQNGFIHNQALANDLAAHFYRALGLDTSAAAHLRQARACYLRWGADGKVKQLDAQHPQLEIPERAGATGTVTTGSSRLDFLAAVKASQAISSQIVLDRLLETLMRVVLESAGAQRGWLAVPEGTGLSIAAEASVQGQEVTVRPRPPAPNSVLPWSILNYVYRSREKVLLADAAAPGPFAADEYVVKERAKSVLCLPVLRQAELIGVLYLENDLVTDAFSADRLAVLEMLAAQVAISMENALLLAKEQAARAAAEAAERRSAFVAHELKTPLATVELELGALTESVRNQNTISSASLSPSLAALKRQFGRLDALIESLLERARVQTGQLTLDRQKLDLTAVIHDVVDLLAHQAERYGCQLVVEAPGPILGNWDRLRLEQVATNLLTNAFKYGTGKPIRIVIDAQGPTARFSVIDQGMGISEADQTRLFEPFARATQLHQRQSLGVGLYLVREIVRAHGGQVHLRSQPGAGSTFTVELPLNAPS